MSKKVAIVGAGVGGLAVASRLAHRGYNVEVFERLPECGGRAHIIEDRGFKFDTGPSFVLMPDFFEEIFSYCHKDIKDYLRFVPLDTHYRIFYPDGDTLTVYKDTERTKQELCRLEPRSASSYDKFIQEIGELYRRVRPLLYSCFAKKDLLNPSLWSLATQLKIHKSYWQIAEKYFKNKKICYALTFEAMFIGVSPFRTPSFYSIITYVDHVQKIYHPLGGMYEIPRALEKIAQEFGVIFHYRQEVKKISVSNHSIILKTKRGECAADRVVVNADYAYALKELLKRKLPKFTYSCSVYLLYLGLKSKLKGFEHHNLFFSRDLRKNLQQIFDDGIVPQEPSFYVHVPTVTDPSLAPSGKDIAYILIPVPNLKKFRGSFSSVEAQLRKVVIDAICQATGQNLEDLIEVEHRFYPEDFIKRYNVQYGATFGLAHTFMQSAFFRPPNFDGKQKNLYFAGASTQPGGGLPPVIASSRIVADLIERRT
ncbi:MAG: phytoene desaturase [Candidatus Omnitrophota bacterium]|nr:MAG: phytoene desaturase [Candidatus Omnitrophota bacterium]